jgi:hypothetical protein
LQGFVKSFNLYFGGRFAPKPPSRSSRAAAEQMPCTFAIFCLSASDENFYINVFARTLNS